MLELEQNISSAVREILSIPSLFPQKSTHEDCQITLTETESDVWKCTVEYPLQLKPQQGSSYESTEESIDQLQAHFSAVHSLLGKGSELYLNLPLSNENYSIHGYFSPTTSTYSLQSKQSDVFKLQFFINSEIPITVFRSILLKHISNSVYSYQFSQSRSHQSTPQQVEDNPTQSKADPLRYSTEEYTVISDSSFTDSYIQFTQHPQIFFEDEFDFTFTSDMFDWPVHIFVHTEREELRSSPILRTPTPIKEHIKKQDKFFTHIESKVQGQFKNYYSPFYSTNDETLSEKDISRLSRLDLSEGETVQSLITKMESLTGQPVKNLSQRLKKTISTVLDKNNCSVLGSTVDSTVDLSTIAEYIHYFSETASDNSQLYVTVSENEFKQELVKHIHAESAILQLHSAEEYSPLMNCSSVEKLANISADLQSYSLTESQKETLLEIQNRGDTPIEYTTVKLRFGTNSNLNTRTQTLTLQQVVKHVNGKKNYLSRFEPKRLIGFVTEDVTEYLGLGSPETALLSVSQEQHNYLKQNINSDIYRTYQKEFEQAQTVSAVSTNNGLYSGTELQDYEKIMTTIVVPEYLKEKVSDTITDLTTSELLDVFSSLISYNDSQNIDLVILLTPQEERQLRPILEQKDPVFLYFESTCYSIEKVPNISDKTSSFNGTNFYALLEAYVSNTTPETILEFIKSSEFQSGKSAVELIEKFVHLECESS